MLTLAKLWCPLHDLRGCPNWVFRHVIDKLVPGALVDVAWLLKPKTADGQLLPTAWLRLRRWRLRGLLRPCRGRLWMR